MRFLGIDYGERRIGVALSEGSLAVPLTIIAHRTRDEDLSRVAALTVEHAADAVVVGLPLLASGDEGEQARRSRRFGAALARRIGVPVLYHDERLSSWAAADAASANPIGWRTRRKRRIDDRAAAIILQSYIDTREQP